MGAQHIMGNGGYLAEVSSAGALSVAGAITGAVTSTAAAPTPRAMSNIGTLGPAGVVTIEGNTQVSPTVVTTLLPHGLVNGDSITFAGSNSDAVLDGVRIVTKITDTTFSVPVNCGTAAGTAGNFGWTLLTTSIATATVVTVGAVHGLRTGDTVTISGSNGTSVDGVQTVTVTGARTFTIPVTVTSAGSAGKVVKTSYYTDVIDRGAATSGGAVIVTSTVGHTTHSTHIDIQGSVDNLNWFNIPYSLVADPRTFVVTQITTAAAATTLYLLQELVFWRYLRLAFSTSTNLAAVVTATYVVVT